MLSVAVMLVAEVFNQAATKQNTPGVYAQLGTVATAPAGMVPVYT